MMVAWTRAIAEEVVRSDQILIDFKGKAKRLS